jgi:hypothetical protein
MSHQDNTAITPPLSKRLPQAHDPVNTDAVPLPTLPWGLCRTYWRPGERL